MATWIELGEVPDSEDEDGFDSQHVEDAQLQPVLATTTTKPTANTTITKPGSANPENTRDIWDFPDSDDNNGDDDDAKTQPRAPPITLPPPSAPNGLDSSPLSTIPSEDFDSQTFFQDDITPKATSIVEEASHDVTPLFYPTVSSHIEVRLAAKLVGDLDVVQSQTSVESLQGTTAPDLHPERQEARHIAMRHERSLRPRKPIQEHPYLIENAHYSTSLRKHGLRPLRMAVEPMQDTDKGVSQDADFELESQEEPQLPEEADESQRRDTIFTLEEVDDLLIPSSPPPASSSEHTARIDNLPESPIIDDQNVFDQDLPDLEQLLNIRPRPRNHSPKLAKRKASQPQSAIRKRQRQGEAHLDEAPGSPDPSNIAFDALSHGLTPPPGSSIEKAPHPPAWPPEQPLRVRIPAIEVPSEGEDDEQGQDTLVGSETPSAQSESKDEELVAKIGKRIRGVLPASWLRLDHQSSRDKPLYNGPKKQQQQQQRSLGKETRRGVAQPRQNGVSSTPTHFLFEQSDEEEEGDEVPSTNQRTINDTSYEQTRLYFQSIAKTAPQEPFSDLLSSDDAQSLIEEDSIDPMLPPRRKQLNILQAFDRNNSRVKKPSSTQNHFARKRSKQPRITSLPHNSRGSNSARPSATEKRQKHRQRPRATHHQGRKMPPPPLSILDVIQADAPRFMRIAARTAKRRKNRGRSSLQRKSIKLASREDNMDALSVLEDWRVGSIKQRPAVSLASQPTPRLQHSPQLLSDRPVNASKIPKNKSRKLVRHVSQGGSVSYRQSGDIRNSPTPKRSLSSKNMSPAPQGPARPAQLEITETEQPSIRKFDSFKRMLDRSYRKQRPNSGMTGMTGITGNIELGLALQLKDTSPEIEMAEESHDNIGQTGHRSKSKIPRFHKQTRPRRIDVQAPQYTHADDPLPMRYVSPCPEPRNMPVEENKLQGLGPYGTRYTHHFEIFPLDSNVYFHESTLIGSGAIDSCSSSGLSSKLSDSRPRIFFNLGQHVLRWGPWDDQVSSELGIVFDFIAEQVLCEEIDKVHFPDQAVALDVTSFVLRYVKDALSLGEEFSLVSFVNRLQQLLSRFCDRVKLHIRRPGQDQRANDSLLMIFDRLLLISFFVLRVCQGDTLLFQEQLQMEEMLKITARCSISILRSIGIGQLCEIYRNTSRSGNRERGLRNDSPAIHSWTLLLQTLELARIPQTSFWDMLEEELDLSLAISGLDVRDYEQIWESLFTLLPLTEFNNCGIIVPGKRYDTMIDGWGIPQKLLRRVFELYQANDRQAPSFNNYCRALVGRCHYLLKQWGWHHSAPVIGVIFDFFGGQNFTHLRNEEVYTSPHFLEELAKGPSLDLGPDDRCFHIFLKLLALSISELRKRGSEKYIRNLVARTIPNHNHQYSKEQNVHERVLAALRNHHDLLCTLYWACPAKLRPPATLIEGLVAAETSHKEACLINIRAWSQLARFAVASGEATSFPKCFGFWRNSFFQKMLQQFDSVASDIQQQFSSLSKDDRKSISEDRIRMTISMNKAATKEILRASLAASLAVMRHSPDLEAASFSFGTPQLQQVFKYFTVSPPELDLSILRIALATLDSFLLKIEKFKDNEESQENESQMLRSAQADDALMVIDNDLSRNFFMMARSFLSSQVEFTSSTTASVDKHRCVGEVVSLAARIGARFVHGGSMRISDMFKPGKHGLFDGHPKSLDLTQRKYLTLFLSDLLRQGFDEFADAKLSLVEVWILSLVKPREYLEYENKLAEQLQRNGKEFVPGAMVGLSIQPDYNSNRDLFKFAVASMRKSIRDSDPSMKKSLLKEYASVLESAMTQIKGDLKFVSQNSLDHDQFVTFIRDIISLIKVHASDICAVDEFFYKISKEYSPSIHDPQLQVAGMVSYGLRLQEGDTKVAYQLFYLLFNNFKFALTTGKLDDDVGMLLKGMKHQGIFSFVLGKMLPSIVRACFIQNAAFVLLDVYVEALRSRMTRNVVAFELDKSDLPQVAVIQRAIIDGMNQMCQRSSTLFGAQAHVLRQTIALMNLMWPSLFILSMSQPQASCWEEIRESVRILMIFAVAAERYLSHLMEEGAVSIQVNLLFEEFAGFTSSKTFDVYVNGFTKDIVDDIARNWIIKTSRIYVHAPGQAKGTQAKEQGVEVPIWDIGDTVKDLYNEIQVWLYWSLKLSGSPTRSHDDREPLFM